MSQASQQELNRFVEVVDKFKANFAKLQGMQADVLASGDPQLQRDYNSAITRGRALNATIDTTVGAWNAFKAGYRSVTDRTSTIIGDAIDEIRSWFGYDPAPGIGNYALYSAQIPPFDPDADILGVDFRDLQSPMAFRPVRERRFVGLGELGAVQIPAAAAVAAIVSAAFILNNLMNKIFIRVEATRIQRENPGIDRGEALLQAERGITQGIQLGAVTPAMLLLGGVALWMIFGQKRR